MPYSTATRGRLQDAFLALLPRIETERVANHAPALSLAVVADQTILWSGGFGFANQARLARADAETAYGVGSITKLFTNTALMRLRVSGALPSLDDPVAHLVPEIAQVTSPFADPQPLTYRQLMSHTSGLPREALAGWEDGQFPQRETLLSSLNQVSLVFAPGSAWKYSNLGYAILGCALGRLVDLVNFFHNDLFQPLDLLQAGFYPGPDEQATGYMLSVDGSSQVALQPLYHAFLPSFGAYMSALDLGKFLAFQFHQGPAGRLPLGESALREQHAPVYLDPEWSQGVALGGWRIQKIADRLTLDHGGAVHGFTASLMCVPSAKIGVVVLTNGFQVDSDWRPSSLAKLIVETLVPVALAEAEAPGQPVQALERYQGRYAIPGLIVLEVRLVEGRLLVAQPGGANSFELVQQEEEHTFLARGGIIDGEVARFVFTDGQLSGVQARGFDLQRIDDAY